MINNLIFRKINLIKIKISMTKIYKPINKIQKIKLFNKLRKIIYLINLICNKINNLHKKNLNIIINKI